MADLRWTPQQVEAIRSPGDTLLVANAGTGKTTTVVGKVLWHLGLPFGVDESGAPLPPPDDPCRLDEIAAITFTEKAAYDLERQLRKRIEASPRADELRWEIDRASVGTIHSFSAELLREHALRLGIDPTFGVIDADEAWAEQDELIKQLILGRLEEGDPRTQVLLQDIKLTGWTHTSGAVDHVRKVMNDLRWHDDRYARWLRTRADGVGPGHPDGPQPDLFARPDGPQPDLFARPDGPDGEPSAGAPGRLDLPALQALCEEWNLRDEGALEVCEALVSLAESAKSRWARFLDDENLRDFDSLILGARDLLTGPEGAAARTAIRDRYRVLIIDEFQDTDFAQRDIAFAIARGVPRPQLFLVGDPKQSIYRFRGADISVWNEVRTAIEADGQVLDLSRNFRSAPPIVEFVNRVGRAAMEETGAALDEERPGSRVDYADLVAGLEDHPSTAVEWIEAEGENSAVQSEAEARRVASQILELVGAIDIPDPDGEGPPRPVQFRDIALLYRARTGLEHFEKALTQYGVPYFVSGATHLGSRQEILDVLNVLRLLQTPRDDLRAFGFLRSPFVGLRDETIARIRLLSRSAPLLTQARRWINEGREWPAAPDHPDLADIERRALADGLGGFEDLQALAARLPLHELIDELLERTGYRLHVLLMDRPEEVLANLQSLIHFAEHHRDLDLATFFEVWDRSMSQDVGIPQAPLYSKEDDVVTLTTIHQAKGLEWPVVFLVGVAKRLSNTGLITNEYWSDPDLGPVYCLKKDDRGPRAERIFQREVLESSAEDARLLYVATTRARDRLVLVGERGGEVGFDRWLARGDATVRPNVSLREPLGSGIPPRLGWLDRYEVGEPPALIASRPEPELRWIHSATELMTKAKDPEAWERRYRHGVEAPWEFAPESGDGGPRLPSTVRGDIIHGVLERLEAAEELSRILDETIGSLDEPELEGMLSPGGEYRERLEEEIRKVVESDEWAWYTEGELGRDYWKELTFTHLVGPRDWRFGAFDLYRRISGEVPSRLREALGLEEGVDSLVIDFKTHPIRAEQAGHVARDYRIQADVYRAASGIAGRAVVGLHFTGPNALVPMSEGGG